MSDGPSSFEVSNHMGAATSSNPGSGKGIIGGGGQSGIDSYMATNIDNHAKAADLGKVLTPQNIDSLNPLGGEGLFNMSVFQFADEAGKMFVGNIDSGPILSTLQHEINMEKTGLGNFSPGKQIGAEKGLSQGIVGRSAGGE